MSDHFRQGDILLQRVDKLPDSGKALTTKIVAYGEVTGKLKS